VEQATSILILCIRAFRSPSLDGARASFAELSFRHSTGVDLLTCRFVFVCVLFLFYAREDDGGAAASDSTSTSDDGTAAEVRQRSA